MGDLNMNVNQFSTAISILYGLWTVWLFGIFLLTTEIVGYIPFQIPSNMIMTKITRPGLCRASLSQFTFRSTDTILDISCAVVVWGMISACTGAAQSYGGLLAVRVILGAIEAAFFPGESTNTIIQRSLMHQ